MKFTSINHKVMAAGLAVFLLAAISAGSGLWVAFHLSAALDTNLRSASVLQTHMEADMMHDALRADMLMAMRASQPGSDITMADVKKDVAEHIQIFEDSIA